MLKIGHFKEYIKKLRTAGLRPTKQRLMISRILFDKKETFHFTIEDLRKLVEKNFNKKISLATVYNTVHVFKKKGYLKKIVVDGSKAYFDTNTSPHHHFYDEETEKLIDIKDSEISLNNLPNSPSGKFIKGVDVMVTLASDNHNHK